MNLRDYDVIVINSSGGKDSQAMLDEMFWKALWQGVVDRLVVVHADLKDMEWQGTAELAETQARHYGIPFIKVGRDETLLDYVVRRAEILKAQGKDQPAWPSKKTRWCTSDFKRAPVATTFTQFATKVREGKSKGYRVRILNCMGHRSQESAERKKKPEVTVFSVDIQTWIVLAAYLLFRSGDCFDLFYVCDKLRTQKPKWQGASSGAREITEYLPIKNWTVDQVWERIRESEVPHHPAYDLGMPRLSCCFCIFAPTSALMVAGKHNPELLDRYIEVEDKTGFTFKHNFSLKEIKNALANGAQQTGPIESWVM